MEPRCESLTLMARSVCVGAGLSCLMRRVDVTPHEVISFSHDVPIRRRGDPFSQRMAIGI